MIKVRAHHVSFPVTEISRARDFYENILGFEQIERPNFPFAGAWYDGGSVQVHLIEVPEGLDVAPRPQSINPLDRHDAFAIDDYTKSLDFLRSKDIEVLETTPEIGQLFVRDPDGNIIELIVDETLEARLAEQRSGGRRPS